jgi:hypothetical protein
LQSSCKKQKQYKCTLIRRNTRQYFRTFPQCRKYGHTDSPGPPCIQSLLVPNKLFIPTRHLLAQAKYSVTPDSYMVESRHKGSTWTQNQLVKTHRYT